MASADDSRAPQRRLGALASQVCPIATAATASNIKVFPPGKHFVTNPTERFARYEGDGGATKAITIPELMKQRVAAVGKSKTLAQKRGARDGPWTFWTWDDYLFEVRRVAKSLMALGCVQHEAVNILGFNAPEWFFSAVGAIFAGLTPAGIYITNTPDGVEYIMSHSKCKVMFVDNDAQLQKVMSVRSRCPSLKSVVHWGTENASEGMMTWKGFTDLSSQTSDRALESRISSQYPDNACYLSYTSGTTGQPKCVMYSHDNIAWGMRNILKCMISQAQPTSLEEREVSYMPLSHIAGNIQLLGQFTLPPHTNSCVYFAFPDAMQGSLVDTLKEVRPTIKLAVPRVWEKLAAGLKNALIAKPELKKDPIGLRAMVGLDAIRASVTGAAPIAPDLMEFWESLGMPIYEVYGMTENTAYSHFNHVTVDGKRLRKIGSVGPALQDEHSGSKLAPGTNEICTWSRGVMMGYMYMPEKTADALDDEGFLRTGDVGTIDEDGLWFITGRIKEMIITAGGENCAPVLLEEAVKLRLKGISNCVTIGDKQKYLIMLITLKLEPNATGGFTNKLAPDARAIDPSCETFEDAQKSKIWQQYIHKGIEEANSAAVSRAQHTRKFAVLPSDFSPVGENPELTPTMKLRREVFRTKYLKDIQTVYGEDFMPF